ncbi:MAG: hypothetical protein ACRDNF_20110 [Streptosporangiaceae bacterium]
MPTFIRPEKVTVTEGGGGYLAAAVVVIAGGAGLAGIVSVLGDILLAAGIVVIVLAAGGLAALAYLLRRDCQHISDAAGVRDAAQLASSGRPAIRAAPRRIAAAEVLSRTDGAPVTPPGPGSARPVATRKGNQP